MAKSNKCKKGYKPVKGKCKRDPFYLGVTKDDRHIVKDLFSRAVLTISAWGVFWAIISLTGLKEQNPWILLVVSILVGIITFRFGFK